MSRSASARIADILEAIALCESYRAHLADEDAEVARMAFDAILRNLAVIGEAVNSLPLELLSAHQNVDWSAVIGMRHFLVHQYFRVDNGIVIDVLDRDLAPVASALREIADRL